jgi:hypothetical protein
MSKQLRVAIRSSLLGASDGVVQEFQNSRLFSTRKPPHPLNSLNDWRSCWLRWRCRLVVDKSRDGNAEEVSELLQKLQRRVVSSSLIVGNNTLASAEGIGELLLSKAALLAERREFLAQRGRF